MRTYLNLSGQSGVQAYDLGRDFIEVQFHRTDKLYRYSIEGVGHKNTEHMKTLAMTGRGLGTFISQHPAVRNRYDRE